MIYTQNALKTVVDCVYNRLVQSVLVLSVIYIGLL
jgi:hypothetical protein